MNARVWARHAWRIQKQTFTYWLNAIARIFIKRTSKQITFLKEGQKQKHTQWISKPLWHFCMHLQENWWRSKWSQTWQKNWHKRGERSCFFRHWCKPEMWCFWISILLRIGISCVPHITRDGHVQFQTVSKRWRNLFLLQLLQPQRLWW